MIMTSRQASNTPRQLNNELNQTLHEDDEDYELEIGNYNPVQTLFNDHGISLISLSSTSYNKIDHHLLQVITRQFQCKFRISSFIFQRRFCIMERPQFCGNPIHKPARLMFIFDLSDAVLSSHGNGLHGVASNLRWILTFQSIPKRMSFHELSRSRCII